MPTATERVQIILLKDWTYGGKTYPTGQILSASPKAVDELTKNGTAELYVPKASDEAYISPVGGNLSLQDIEAVIRGIAEERRKEIDNRPIAHEESYFKTGAFHSFSHMCYDIYKAGPDGARKSAPLAQWEEKVKAAGMSEGIGEDGGYLLPTEFRNEILRVRLAASVIRARARVIPMSSNTIKIPYIKETDRSSSVFGGVIIYRPAEGGTKTASAPKFGQITMSLNKLIGMVYATDELLQDSPVSLQPLLTQMFAEALAYTEEEDFINGTGAGMAMGVLNAPCLISVAKETGQAADTIVLDNIIKMWSRMWPMSHGNAIWLANPDCFPELAKLAIAVGTGGSAAGLIGSDATKAPTNTILGRPLDLNPHCQTVGDLGDLILGDWSQYLIGEKVGQSMQVDTSIHVRFVYDETAFRFVMRYDGQPWWASALTPKHGSNTLSPFVALAARA